jgi:hypothetical protein
MLVMSIVSVVSCEKTRYSDPISDQALEKARRINQVYAVLKEIQDLQYFWADGAWTGGSWRERCVYILASNPGILEWEKTYTILDSHGKRKLKVVINNKYLAKLERYDWPRGAINCKLPDGKWICLDVA